MWPRGGWNADIADSEMFSAVKPRGIDQRRVVLDTLGIFQKIARRFALREGHHLRLHDLRSQQFGLPAGDV